MSEANALADRIQVLNVERGDILVVRVEQYIDVATATRIREMIEEKLQAAGKTQAPVLVLGGGMTLEILRTKTGESPQIEH